MLPSHCPGDGVAYVPNIKCDRNIIVTSFAQPQGNIWDFLKSFIWASMGHFSVNVSISSTICIIAMLASFTEDYGMNKQTNPRAAAQLLQLEEHITSHHIMEA